MSKVKNRNQVESNPPVEDDDEEFPSTLPGEKSDKPLDGETKAALEKLDETKATLEQLKTAKIEGPVNVSMCDSRTDYPREFPLKALEELRMLCKGKIVTERLKDYGRCIWELQGAAMHIYIGDPNPAPITAAIIDPAILSQELLELRELLYRAMENFKLAASRINTNSKDIQIAMLMTEVGIKVLAYLRKAAMESR